MNLVEMLQPSTSWHLQLPSEYSAHKFEIIDSTNTHLKSLAGDGAQHLTLAVSKIQTAGRARGDRTWESEEGNVYWSVLLRPDPSSPSLSTLPFVAALATHDTVSSFLTSEKNVQIKWPNDILVEGKKISGCLLESNITTHSAGDSWIVVGIGINVQSFPSGSLNYQATSLVKENSKLARRDSVIEKLSDRFLVRFQQWLSGGSSDIVADVEKRISFLGEEVEVSPGTDRSVRIRGRFAALSPDGQMMLEIGDETRLIGAGDVFGI
ncbi:MAG: biotin--[acetyl-CoA-carboxylase] ligase [Cyanobacteria bacterium P01_H01_bin.15]